MKLQMLGHNNNKTDCILIVDKKTGTKWIADGLAVIYEREVKDKMVYYNQYDKRWANIPYPSKNHPKATIQTSGCGVTVGAMIIATLSDKKITPIEMAKYSLKNGYRALEGTSEELFPALAKKYNLKYNSTYSFNEMFAEVKKGKLAIGLMSNWFKSGTGHYIIINKIIGNFIKIKDPASTLNSAKLYTKYEIRQKGTMYFIFGKQEQKDEFVEAIKYLDKIGVADAKYWNSKRKIDKYFPELIQKIVTHIKKK